MLRSHFLAIFMELHVDGQEIKPKHVVVIINI